MAFNNVEIEHATYVAEHLNLCKLEKTIKNRTWENHLSTITQNWVTISSWSQVSSDHSLKTVFPLILLIRRPHLKEQRTTAADGCGSLASQQ